MECIATFFTRDGTPLWGRDLLPRINAKGSIFMRPRSVMPMEISLGAGIASIAVLFMVIHHVSSSENILP